MNSAVIRTALFIRDLLQQPEGEVVIIGRTNMRRDDFTGLQIVIDALGPIESITRGDSYDGDAEEFSYSQQVRAGVTVDFYGDGAYEQAKRFRLLTRSQLGMDLKAEHGIDVYLPSSIEDLKLKTGEQFSQRYQVACNVIFTETESIDTLRIDTAQIDQPIEG